MFDIVLQVYAKKTFGAGTKVRFSTRTSSSGIKARGRPRNNSVLLGDGGAFLRTRCMDLTELVKENI